VGLFSKKRRPGSRLSPANASGFLLVSLSKTPRLGVHGFAPALLADAFPIKASDNSLRGKDHQRESTRPGFGRCRDRGRSGRVIALEFLELRSAMRSWIWVELAACSAEAKSLMCGFFEALMKDLDETVN
jgi:hypothetical protein